MPEEIMVVGIRGCVELVLTLTFLASEFDSAKLEEHRVRGKTPWRNQASPVLYICT